MKGESYGAKSYSVATLDQFRAAVKGALAGSMSTVIDAKVEDEMSAKAASLIALVFEKDKGKSRRFSIQTDQRLYRNAAAIVEQAVRFKEITPQWYHFFRFLRRPLHAQYPRQKSLSRVVWPGDYSFKAFLK